MIKKGKNKQSLLLGIIVGQADVQTGIDLAPGNLISTTISTWWSCRGKMNKQATDGFAMVTAISGTKKHNRRHLKLPLLLCCLSHRIAPGSTGASIHYPNRRQKNCRPTAQALVYWNQNSYRYKALYKNLRKFASLTPIVENCASGFKRDISAKAWNLHERQKCLAALP